VGQAAPHTTSVVSTDGNNSEDGSGSTPPGGTPTNLPPVPRLNSAAFLVGDRERVTASDIERLNEATASPRAAEPMPTPMEAKLQPTSSLVGKQARESDAEPLQTEGHEGAPQELVSDVILGTTKLSHQFGLI